jgi:serine/threonine protein kinase
VRTIPDYKVIEKLGEGPQSVVYKAFRKKNSHRPLCLKILKGVFSDSQRAFFRQRIEHLKLLQDPSLITPLSFEVKGGVSFVTQGYFDGITLDEWVKTQTKIALDDFFTIACKLAQALDKVHEAGIVHGGIKPHNILIQQETLDIRLIDSFLLYRSSGTDSFPPGGRGAKRP